MATTVQTVCLCGESLTIYVPKKLLFESLVGFVGPDEMPQPTDPAELERIDAEEIASGEVDRLKFIANLTGSQFVDGRQKPFPLCPVCSYAIDVCQILRGKDRPPT